jgi:alkanesulfonate monooxygenase SsuD/methylene tetrahydromethanopterin reductase-like flavin-dependent oxidoreductase (luciferase family)
MRERTMPAIERGLAAAGRARADIEVTTEVIVGVGRTDEELEAAGALKSTIAFYASTPAYRAVLDTEGAGELQPELNALSKQGRWADMTSLITDDLMHTIATATASAPTSPATSRATTSSPSSPPPSTRRNSYTPVLM